MKVTELLESTKFLPESAPTPGNVDDAFTVGDVRFDNHKGLGNTPMGANVLYKGAVAWIKPSKFRMLAVAADRSDTAADLVKLMKDGKSVAVPWLDIDIIGDDPSNPEKVKVTGHEGRARADAFKTINGDVYMPVQLHPIGLRARHLSPEFFKWIEEHGIVAERSGHVVKPDAKMYYWNGETVTV